MLQKLLPLNLPFSYEPAPLSLMLLMKNHHYIDISAISVEINSFQSWLINQLNQLTSFNDFYGLQGVFAILRRLVFAGAGPTLLRAGAGAVWQAR